MVSQRFPLPEVENNMNFLYFRRGVMCFVCGKNISSLR